MKKLSISLFAVLAIAFAVTTAFTTSKRFALVDKWQAKIVASGLTTSATAQQAFDNPIQNLNALSTSSLGSQAALQNLIVSFYETRDAADYDLADICTSGSGSPLCGAEVKVQDDTNTPAPFDSYISIPFMVQGVFDDPAN